MFRFRIGSDPRRARRQEREPSLNTIDETPAVSRPRRRHDQRRRLPPRSRGSVEDHVTSGYSPTPESTRTVPTHPAPTRPTRPERRWPRVDNHMPVRCVDAPDAAPDAADQSARQNARAGAWTVGRLGLVRFALPRISGWRSRRCSRRGSDLIRNRKLGTARSAEGGPRGHSALGRRGARATHVRRADCARRDCPALGHAFDRAVPIEPSLGEEPTSRSLARVGATTRAGVG